MRSGSPSAPARKRDSRAAERQALRLTISIYGAASCYWVRTKIARSSNVRVISSSGQFNAIRTMRTPTRASRGCTTSIITTIGAAILTSLSRSQRVSPIRRSRKTQGAVPAVCRRRFPGNLGRARAEAETAPALSPNYALAYSVRCIAELYNGDPLAAIPWMERAIRLDPGFSHQYLHFLGMAYLTAAKYETAAALFKERILL